jgi:hypothetical protein
MPGTTTWARAMGWVSSVRDIWRVLLVAAFKSTYFGYEATFSLHPADNSFGQLSGSESMSCLHWNAHDVITR